MVIQYKCPDCGADMVFDSKSGMLSCPSCGLYRDVESMTPPESDAIKNTLEAEGEVFGDFEDFQEEIRTKTFESDEAVQYQCNNCGAVIMTDADTTATTCSFCGAGVILGDRLSGQLAPTKIIPFSVSKSQAQEAFKKWCKKGILAPKGFASAERIKNITGMYVPFWLYDLNGRGEVNASCTRVRTYERGDYIYTETSYYDVYRKVDLNYDNIPADASEKMNDALMDKLEPFYYDNLKKFNTPYLSGFFAEKYNYDANQLFPRVQKRAEKYVNDYILSTISGYNSTTFTRKWIDIRKRKAEYALFPVWMISYDYQQEEHMFAMNGQTGKIVGKPPISKGKTGAWFLGITAVLFAISRIITVIMGGPLL